MNDGRNVDLNAVCTFLPSTTTLTVATNVETVLGQHAANCPERFHLHCPDWLDTIRAFRGHNELEEFVSTPDEYDQPRSAAPDHPDFAR